MLIEFICPAESADVILSAEMDGVPQPTNKIAISGVNYRVYDVELVPLDAGHGLVIGLIVNVIKDEIEQEKK